MKKFTLYAWCADDEGGYGVCLSDRFSTSLGYDPESGWRARPSEKVDDFDSYSELKGILYREDKDMYDMGIIDLNQDASTLWDIACELEEN